MIKRYLFALLVVAFTAGTAFGESSDRLTVEKISQHSICRGNVLSDVSTARQSPCSPKPLLLAQRQCDYGCLDRCREGCKSFSDNRDYHRCMDQCQGMCGCR